MPLWLAVVLLLLALGGIVVLAALVIGVTKLATTGGFLRAGNTTLISGVEDDKLQDALGVIEKICKSREQITASTTPMGGAGGVYVPYPIRVTVGGATVFVLEVSQFLKV